MPVPGRDAIELKQLVWDETEPHTYGACPDVIPPPQTAGPPTIRLSLSGAGGPFCDTLLDEWGHPPLLLASPDIPETTIQPSVLAEIWEGWLGGINAGEPGLTFSHYVRITRIMEEAWVVSAFLLLRLQDNTLQHVKYFHGGSSGGFSSLIKGASLSAMSILACSSTQDSTRAVFQSTGGRAIIRAGR